MPTLAALTQRYRQSSGQLEQLPPVCPDEIAALHAQRDHLGSRLDKGCTFLDDLAQRVGQDSPAFERYFAEWLRIKDEYEAVCDEIIVLEARKEFVEWLKTLPPPTGRRARDKKEGTS